MDDIDAGTVSSVAFVADAGPSWPLPVYEIALLAAGHAHDAGRQLAVTVAIGDRQPLQAFGGVAGTRITELLQDAGITLYTGVTATVPTAGTLLLEPGRRRIAADRTIGVTTITGPNIRGIPGDATDRFVPVDRCSRVLGTDGTIFGAGDATDLPIKHGSLAAQQADTAAAGMAHLMGLGPAPDPLAASVRGALTSGPVHLFMSAYVVGDHGWQAEIYDQPPWPSDDQVVAAELGPYLRHLSATESRPPEWKSS